MIGIHRNIRRKKCTSDSFYKNTVVDFRLANEIPDLVAVFLHFLIHEMSIGVGWGRVLRDAPKADISIRIDTTGVWRTRGVLLYSYYNTRIMSLFEFARTDCRRTDKRSTNKICTPIRCTIAIFANALKKKKTYIARITVIINKPLLHVIAKIYNNA